MRLFVRLTTTSHNSLILKELRVWRGRPLVTHWLRGTYERCFYRRTACCGISPHTMPLDLPLKLHASYLAVFNPRVTLGQLRFRWFGFALTLAGPVSRLCICCRPNLESDFLVSHVTEDFNRLKQVGLHRTTRTMLLVLCFRARNQLSARTRRLEEFCFASTHFYFCFFCSAQLSDVGIPFLLKYSSQALPTTVDRPRMYFACLSCMDSCPLNLVA